jgi:phosphoglycerol transferase MdoB-like AlkP superfamily enzyme
MSSYEVFTWAVNLALVLQAFFTVGATVMSLMAYRQHSALRHIVAVSVAHILLVLLSTYNIFSETVPKWDARVAVAFAAYLLSDYSLLVLLRRGHYVDYYERLKSEGLIADEEKPLNGGPRA